MLIIELTQIGNMSSQLKVQSQASSQLVHMMINYNYRDCFEVTNDLVGMKRKKSVYQLKGQRP